MLHANNFAITLTCANCIRQTTTMELHANNFAITLVCANFTRQAIKTKITRFLQKNRKYNHILTGLSSWEVTCERFSSVTGFAAFGALPLFLSCCFINHFLISDCHSHSSPTSINPEVQTNKYDHQTQEHPYQREQN